jgi:hypothetical protein
MAARPRYAYLGPAGTFTETAVRQVADPKTAEYVPQPDVVAALDAVRSGTAEFAVVAIENSVEGSVTAVLDTLAAGDLMMVGEVVVPVSFDLAAPEETELSAVRRIAAHPHAWAQCRHWLAAHAPDAMHVAAASNTISTLCSFHLPRWTSTRCTFSPRGSRTTPARSPVSWWSHRTARSGRPLARTRHHYSSTSRTTRRAHC